MILMIHDIVYMVLYNAWIYCVKVCTYVYVWVCLLTNSLASGQVVCFLNKSLVSAEAVSHIIVALFCCVWIASDGRVTHQLCHLWTCFIVFVMC